MGTEFLNLKEPEEVKNILNSLVIDNAAEKVELTKSFGRILAENIYSTMDLPPFDRVAMDGYAVRAENIFGASEDEPKALEMIDVVRAGDNPLKSVENDTCIEVGTGAPAPPLADAVVMVEFTERSGNEILIYQGVAPGENIVKKGSDLKKDILILKKATILTPDKIGVLSAMGIKEVLVYFKPKVGIISTGNEIVAPGREINPGEIYDVNSQTVAATILACGCLPTGVLIVKDDFQSLKNAINSLMDSDIIITSGGTSAGAGDVLRAVVEDMGEILVHGIAIKPGKPTLIGRIDNKTIIGLPGYPVAALLILETFVVPFLRRNLGLAFEEDGYDTIQIEISRRFHTSRGRTHNLLVKVKNGFAIPILKDSGAITALAEADGYIEIPKNTEIIEKGTLVDVKLFRQRFTLF
ncbi:MAG TPA: gephyrin-like molybdotransferase Glp [Methanobacteriaceae archaeon]|nr:gephyrin-like molybdotransferase Glp [Methanobacteriaceae archaeon]